MMKYISLQVLGMPFVLGADLKEFEALYDLLEPFQCRLEGGAEAAQDEEANYCYSK